MPGTDNADTVIQVSGRLDANTSSEIGASLNHRIDQGHNVLIIDLSALDYVSSAGLRIFLAAAKRLRGNGGELIFCNLQPAVLDVFEMSGFTTLFRTFDSIEAARSELG